MPHLWCLQEQVHPPVPLATPDSLAAVMGITSGAADFLGPSGIRVCSVSPAVVASTLMGPDRIPYFESELNAGVIFPRRTSQPAEVAHGILYLIENSMMNDFHLKIDGGWRGSSNWGGDKDRTSPFPGRELYADVA
jgi:3-hydroxyacyl-CoA dehydrogenase